MIKRLKEEPLAGVLEFAGRTSEDPEFLAWMAEHRAQNGGKLRVSKGGSGVRVAFSKQADMTTWAERSKKAARNL